VSATVLSPARPVDQRAASLLADASAEVAASWTTVQAAAGAELPVMGLAAGDRPLADVEVLAGAMASCEYLVASRMHAATIAGCLPFGERGAVLAARGWSPALARRLARCAALAATHPAVAAVWSAGIIASEHVDPLARMADRFTLEELAAVIGELGPRWGSWSPAAIARFVAAADRMLHPPSDPDPNEADAYETRSLSFSILRDTVILAGELPRLEGELVIAAIDALAEKLRSTADHVPAGARRADALVQLVNDAHAADLLPTRGGLPVALSVTVEHTALGDPVWSTSRGHQLTAAEARWAGCDAAVTPVLVETGPWCGAVEADASEPAGPAGPAGPAARIAALAAALFDTRIPLQVGRTARTATPAQRRALAVRDRGCVIPGCTVPAEACQAHHLVDWALGGRTDADALVLLCWAHHRQVDLQMWTIDQLPPGAPPPPEPNPGAPPGTTWPANNGSPFLVRRTPRTRWRL
jgi:5-methylcytosine-specific restriction protein A